MPEFLRATFAGGAALPARSPSGRHQPRVSVIDEDAVFEPDHSEFGTSRGSRDGKEDVGVATASTGITRSGSCCDFGVDFSTNTHDCSYDTEDFDSPVLLGDCEGGHWPFPPEGVDDGRGRFREDHLSPMAYFLQLVEEEEEERAQREKPFHPVALARFLRLRPRLQEAEQSESCPLERALEVFFPGAPLTASLYGIWGEDEEDAAEHHHPESIDHFLSTRTTLSTSSDGSEEGVLSASPGFAGSAGFALRRRRTSQACTNSSGFSSSVADKTAGNQSPENHQQEEGKEDALGRENSAVSRDAEDSAHDSFQS